jgi:tRNA (guanine-N7-)-methyltransferase
MQTIPHIRTFSGRHGRLSLTQKRAMGDLLTRFQMPKDPWRFDELFDSKKVIIEIGSGDGKAPLAYAKEFSDQIIIAIDVYTPGIAQLMHEAAQQQIDNLRVVIGDAIEVFQELVPNKSLSGLHIFFPDPWPKKRHHKRRILNEKNLEIFQSKLKPQAKILIATDWDEYAQVVQDELKAKLQERPQWRPITKFEKRAIRDGRKVSELVIE